MSIDPTGLTNIGAPLPGTKTAVNSSAEMRREFDHKLDSAVNLLKNNGKSSSDATAKVRLAQLKMLHGLFSVDDSDEDDTFFSGLERLTSLQRMTLLQSQINDKYARQQYSLGSEPVRSLDRLIDRVAEKVSLAPELIHSVVSAESGYNPAAVSHAGARGLMQLMPETAAELGVKDSFDPEQNLVGGSRYLKQLLDKYNGDLDHALAAYNWGQGNVDRYGIENLPSETRNYVAKVKSLLAARKS